MKIDNTRSDFVDNYLKYRNVRPEDYHNYTLPAYFSQVLPSDRNAVILDIGCGFGQMLNSLRSLGYSSLSGVDVSQPAVDYCVTSGLNVALIEDLDSFCDLATERFDFIIMNHVVEHLCKSQIIGLLSKIRVKLLKQGGRIFVTTPNAQSPTGCYWAYEDFTHSTIFTAGSLSFVLRSAGFEKVSLIDPLGIAGSHIFIRTIRSILVIFYSFYIRLLNVITNSSFHRSSPQVYTYELKALAW